MASTAQRRGEMRRRSGFPAVDPHEIAEQSRLLSHRLYATEIRRRPALLEEARHQINVAVSNSEETVGERLWQVLLRLELEAVISHMLDEGEAGRLLRSNSPFSRLIGLTDKAARTRLWKQARAEVSAKRTSTVRSAA